MLGSLVTWNARVGRSPLLVAASVRQIVRDTDTDALALLEARSYAPALRRALPGWRVIIRDSDVVFLVRRGIPMRRAVALRIDRRWWGPKQGRAHVGRAHLLVDIGRQREPGALRLILVHRVPGGPSGGIVTRGANRPAWMAEHLLLHRVAEKVGSLRRGLLIAGDQNAETSDRDPASPGGLADAIGARIVRTGAKVDWALARGVKVAATRLDNYGSDHPAVLYRIDHKES